MSKVNDAIAKAGIFFLATVDGSQPKLRPLGLHIEADGKTLFGVGDFKAVYKQLQTNPQCEIVAMTGDGNWLRYTGKAVFETNPCYAEAALQSSPDLRSIYNEQTGYNLMMFHLENATAVLMPSGENLLS